MMHRVVMPVSACVLATLTFGPAFARDYSHHQRHIKTFKHSHHHSWRTHSRHSYRWRSQRQIVMLPQAYEQPVSAPFAWQPAAAPPFPVVWQRPIVRPVVPAVPVAPAVAWQPASPAPSSAIPGQFGSLVSAHAQANGIPESLVHRVIMRESRYNPRAVSRGNYGLMQIRLATARSMGYTGSAAGLLDANTNMTYAVRYLAGAYRAAGGNPHRAVAYYARGYYHQAKRAGVAAYARATMPPTTTPVAVASTFRTEVF